MKDYLLDLARAEPDVRRRLNVVREYLQTGILRSLQQAGAFASLAFQGGSALRFLYGLRRYSEDLDFSLERPERGYAPEALIERIERDFTGAGHEVEVGLKTEHTLHFAAVKFPGLLHDCGLSPLPAHKLTIRLDIDTRPPQGAVLEHRLVTRYIPVSFLAHDLASRPERPVPNIVLLANALRQVNWPGSMPGEDSWTGVLADHLSGIDWREAERDVAPFLEDPADAMLMDRDLVLAEIRDREKR